MRRLAAQTLEDAAVAQTEIRQLIRKGLGSEAFNLSKAAGALRDEARRLEDDAHAQELRELELTKAQGQLILDVIERGYGDVDLPMPRGFIEALLRGWPGAVDQDVLKKAREEIARAIRAEARAELLAELEEARLTRLALGAGEDEVTDAEVVEDSADETDEAMDAEAVEAEELPDDLEIDSAGNYWRRAFRDRDGISHAREAVAPARTPPPEEPSRAFGRYDRRRLGHPALGDGA